MLTVLFITIIFGFLPAKSSPILQGISFTDSKNLAIFFILLLFFHLFSEFISIFSSKLLYVPPSSLHSHCIVNLVFFPTSYSGYRDCNCVKVNSCQWSKKLQDEVKNIQTNSVEDIKVKRKKIKEIKDHWCTLKNGNIGVNCCQNDKPPKCRTGCDCRSFKHCDWSLRDVQILSMLNETQTLYMVTNRKFRENICSAPEKKVCCCGVREVIKLIIE